MGKKRDNYIFQLELGFPINEMTIESPIKIMTVDIQKGVSWQKKEVTVLGLRSI